MPLDKVATGQASITVDVFNDKQQRAHLRGVVRDDIPDPAYPNFIIELEMESLSSPDSLFPTCRMGNAENHHLGKCRVKACNEST